MPRGTTLTEGEIRWRLQDLRNKTALHAAARQRVLLLEQENEELWLQLREREAAI